MQQMKTQGALARTLMAFIFFTLFAVGLAFGQTEEAVRAEIPYEFTFASKVLPAGTYTFSVTNLYFRVQSATGEVFNAPIITRIVGPAAFLRDGSLLFDKTGGGHILCEVWIPGEDGILLHSIPKNHAREVLLFSNVNRTRTLSGKAAYSQTCARCHGTDGRGDERADEFFKITIPRLSSVAVQSKSDAELKVIITKGTQTMPPVEIDESTGFRHRLPPQDVDAVVAYVRTLKL